MEKKKLNAKLKNSETRSGSTPSRSKKEKKLGTLKQAKEERVGGKHGKNCELPEKTQG